MQTDCDQILIVDDDASYAAMVSTLFQRVGYATQEASTGEAALEAALRKRPSCVLLDVLLPGVSGYEVCRELRDAYGEELPIIFVTGERTESSDRVAGLLVGADDYLVKPVDPDELVARVRRFIARSRSLARFSDRRPPASELTRREREVLGLLADGLGQAAIARELFITSKTVATHVQRILSKLGVHSRAQAVALAHRERLVEPRSSGAGSRTS